MAQRRDDLVKIMKEINIDQNAFTEEDIKLMENGGYSLSDSNLGNESLQQSKLSMDFNEYESKGGRRANEIDIFNLKTKYTALISMAEKDNAFLQQEIKRLLATTDAEKKKMAQDFEQERQTLIKEIQTSRTREMQTSNQIPLIKDALVQVRDMLNGLIPETTYLKLRDLPERDLTPSEWVLINVWDLVYPAKRDQDINRKEVFALREEIKHLNQKMQQQLNELEHANKMLFDKDDDYKRHGLNYQNARRGLELELEKALEELVILREKTVSFDSLQRDFKKLEQEKFLVEEKLGYYDKENSNNAFTSDRAAFFRQQDDLRRKGDLLESDKAYLTKENITLLEKNKRLEDRIDRMESEVVEAKRSSQEYLFQLLNMKGQNATEYESKVNREINELKDKHAYQLEQTKNNLVDIYEKQIRFLREEREEQENRAERLNSQLKEHKQAHEHLLLDNRTLQRTVESDMAELRISYRIKQEEHERLQGIYEETLTNLKATRQEVEMLREKLNVLKSEYYKVEVNAEKNQCSISAQLAVCKEQLRDYESIEKDIDQAVVAFGADGANSDNLFYQTIQHAPTSTRRRVQQALNLAQRLNAKQKDYEALQTEHAKLKDDHEQAMNELQLARDLLDKSKQPSQYLIQTIQDKDSELLRYKDLLKKNERSMDQLKLEHSDLKSAYERNEQDIKRLMVKREHIHNIQTLLLNLVNSSDSNTQQQANNVLRDIQDVLQDKNVQGGGGLLIKPSSYQSNNFSKYDKSPPEKDQLTSQSYQPQTNQLQQFQSAKDKPAWFDSLKKTLKRK